MRKRIAVIAAALLLLCGCRPIIAKQERTGFALDTVVNVTLYETRSSALLDGCFAELERLESLLSATREGSDIARINAANGAAVTVSKETTELLTVAQQVSARSNGAFDITIRPVSLLWNFSADQPALPDEVALTAALTQVDYRRVHIEDDTVAVNGSVEPGGIAKGYIADCLREYLHARGVSSALLDLGGNIVALGDKGGEPFRIGIKDPANVSSLAAVVRIADRSVVTSGTYERGFTLDGVRYHHLLDPKTGHPVQNGLASVSIVAESSALADALSTACFVLGEEQARELLAQYPDVQALFIYENGRLTTTDGLVKADNGDYVLA